MKIIVCAKQIRHTYARTGTSPESHYIRPEDGVYRVNPHDEAALELALRLKDEDENTTVVLLTLGPMIAEDEIRRCLAAGADDLYQIQLSGPAPPEGDPPDLDPLDQAEGVAGAVPERDLVDHAAGQLKPRIEDVGRVGSGAARCDRRLLCNVRKTVDDCLRPPGAKSQ